MKRCRSCKMWGLLPLHVTRCHRPKGHGGEHVGRVVDVVRLGRTTWSDGDPWTWVLGNCHFKGYGWTTADPDKAIADVERSTRRVRT